MTEENELIPQLTVEEAKKEILMILMNIRKNSEIGFVPDLNCEDREYGRVLVLQVHNNSTLPKGTNFTITPQGLLNSKRNNPDRRVYFGNKRKALKSGVPTSDIVIPCAQSPIREPQFMIYYHNSSFYLKDLGLGTGTFVRLTETLSIKSGVLVNIGESYVFFNILDREHKVGLPGLAIKVYSGLRIGEVKYFDADDWDIKEIYIGRGKDCQVVVEDCLVSSHQVTVFFSRVKGWMIVDGDLGQQKPSTNGTW